MTQWRSRRPPGDVIAWFPFGIQDTRESAWPLAAAQYAASVVHKSLVLIRRGHLEKLGIFLSHAGVSRRHVVAITGAQYLLPIAVIDAQTAFQHIAPVWALTAILGKPLQERAKISPGRD